MDFQNFYSFRNRFFGLCASLVFLTSGAQAATTVPVACEVQALVNAKAEFLRIRDLRETDPGAIAHAEFQASATRYVEMAEACYAEKYGAGSVDPGRIDDGGLWFSESSATVAEFVTHGTKWGGGSPFAGGLDTPGPGLPGGLVTYSFMPDGVDISAEGSSANVAISSLPTFAPCFIDEIEDSFDAWSAVANISFAEVTDDGLPFNSGASGDIRIGAHLFDGPSGTIAHGYFPPPNGSTAAGDVHFDEEESWLCVDVGPGIDIGIVTLHELGHAIGLSHETPPPTAIMNPSYSAAVDMLQPDDITAAESIYGGYLPGCDMDTSQASYSGSEIVTISSFAISNLSSSPAAVEWKAWLTAPGIGSIPFINLGADGAFVLGVGFAFDFGVNPLFEADTVPSGSYVLGCRVLNPVTGALIYEDLHGFDVVP